MFQDSGQDSHPVPTTVCYSHGEVFSRLTFGVSGAEADKSQKLAWMLSVKQNITLLYLTFTSGILVA